MSVAKSITALLMAGAFFSTAVHATPLLPRSNVCDTKPTATSGSAEPIASPTVTKAVDCQAACEALSTCKSFVFGLPKGEPIPRCLLYPVPAAKVPVQDDGNLVVFDVACAEVPTGVPTSSDPVGKDSSNGNTNVNNQVKSGENKSQQKRDVCGAAPSGPATANPAPMRTETSIITAEACLILCQMTAGCKAIEFGRPAPNEPLECLLFSVPVSSLPPSASGATFVGYDIGC